MKTSRFYSMIALALSLIILSSCATSHVNNGGIFNKRKHNKGFHLSWNKSTKGTSIKEQIAENNELSALSHSEIDEASVVYINESRENTTLNNAASFNVNDEEQPIVKTTNKSHVSEKQFTQSALNPLPSSDNVRVSKTEFNKKAATKKDQKKNGSSDVSFILILILCFLLPPLAVFLHRGGIDTMFWISLVLTLLFWLPGIIFALWVVLVS